MDVFFYMNEKNTKQNKGVAGAKYKRTEENEARKVSF